MGGELPELLGEQTVQTLIDYTDSIYLEFGADRHVEGVGNDEKVKEIRKRAIQAGLRLVDCPIRHLGTEKAQQIYLAIQNFLLDNGVQIQFAHSCENLLLDGDHCRGVLVRKVGKPDERLEILAGATVIATGRRGADWLEQLCEEHDIAHQPGTVDIGVRVEVRNEIMEYLSLIHI